MSLLMEVTKNTVSCARNQEWYFLWLAIGKYHIIIYLTNGLHCAISLVWILFDDQPSP